MSTQTVAQYMRTSQEAYSGVRQPRELGRVLHRSPRLGASPSVLRLKFVAPLIAFVVTDLADFQTTVMGIHTGVSHEGDPLMASVILHFGLGAILYPLILGTVVAVLSLKLGCARGYRVLTTGVVVGLWFAAIVHGMAAYSNAAILHNAGVGL